MHSNLQKNGANTALLCSFHLPSFWCQKLKSEWDSSRILMTQRTDSADRSKEIRYPLPFSLTPAYLVFFSAMIFGTLIRIHLAITAPINMDENFYAFDGHLLQTGLTLFQDFPTRSPLMIIISAAILETGGDFYTLRLVAVFFSVATGVLIFHTGRIMGGQRIGAFASVLFFLSPYSIRYGYVFFTQPFEAFLVGVSFTWIVHWIQKQSIRDTNAKGIDSSESSRKDIISSHSSENNNDHRGIITTETTRTNDGGGRGAGLEKKEKGAGDGGIREEVERVKENVDMKMMGKIEVGGKGEEEVSERQHLPEEISLWKQHGLLLLSGVILGLAAFIRRNSIAFFPAGIFIITLYQYMGKYAGPSTSEQSRLKCFIPQIMFTLGYFSVLIPGILLFLSVTGMSYTTYFFYSDYLQAHSSICWNILFSILYLDSRGFYFLSVSMLFLTFVIYKSVGTLISRLGFTSQRAQELTHGTFAFLLFLWILALLPLAGNNLKSSFHGLIYALGLLSIFGLVSVTVIFPDSGPLKFLGRYSIMTRFSSATFLGIMIILISGSNFFLPFCIVILLNFIALFLLFRERILQRISLSASSATGFPLPLIITGIFFLSILLFYILFRVLLPYYYDLLFPLCLITAFLVTDILDFETGNPSRFLILGKSLFICSLILSVPIGLGEFTYGDIKPNETEIEDFDDVVRYLRAYSNPHEEIFTAKAVIALQADLENIFNIVRPSPYLNNDTDLLDRMDYPSIREITDYLESHAIRFIVLDWVMQTYFLDIYQDLNEYVSSHYHLAEEFGSILILIRNG